MPYQQIERGIELLKLCQRLQSEKDGLDRPEPYVVDKSKVMDDFSRDVGTSIALMASLHDLIPLKLQLAELGRKLETEGLLKVGCGEDYSHAALQYFTVEHGLQST